MDGNDDDFHTHSEFPIHPSDWTSTSTINPSVLQTPNISTSPYAYHPAQPPLGGVAPPDPGGYNGVWSDPSDPSGTRSLADDQAEGSLAQIMRQRGACLKCKIQKGRCSHYMPCESCAKGKHENSAAYSWMRCIVLDLERFNPFSIDLNPAAQTHWYDFQSTPEMAWSLNSPRDALGQQTAMNISYGSATSPTNFSGLLQHCFGLEFLERYSFLVNPNIPILISSKYSAMNSYGGYDGTDSLAVTWEALAAHRARCGTFVLQNLMDKRFNNIWRDVKRRPEQEKLPLFLIVTGTLFAAAATRRLPYIQSHYELDATLRDLNDGLAHCMIFLGKSKDWPNFINYDGPEEDLLNTICSFPEDENVIPLIRPEVLDEF